MINTSPISFTELLNSTTHNDSNSVVLIAVLFEANQNLKEVEEYLSDGLGFSKGKHLVGVRHITGNLLGEYGRSDYLLEFDNEQVQFNPIARLRFPDLTWTSDYLVNYRKDYIEE